MLTMIDDRNGVHSRPAALFDADGNLEVRASAVSDCRRALWYAAAGHPVTNPPTEESLTVMEAGIALEPVVLRAMRRAGWDVTPAHPQHPRRVSVQLGPRLTVAGHPDAVAAPPCSGGVLGVVEVKARGPEAFRRWRILGAERSHPSSAAQAACYTFGLFGEARDAVIATMDTGSRAWEYEMVPAERVARALDAVSERLAPLGAHLARNGPDPDALPERDFSAGSRQCRTCPFLDACRPGGPALSLPNGASVAEVSESTEPEERMTEEEAQRALLDYEELQDTIREFEDEKRWVVDRLRAWLRWKGVDKARLQGRERPRTVGMIETRRYAVDHRRLNALLDPRTRAEIVTETVSKHLWVS